VPVISCAGEIVTAAGSAPVRLAADRPVRLEPFPLKLGAVMVPRKVWFVVAFSRATLNAIRASGTVPLLKLPAFKLVKDEPLPLKLLAVTDPLTVRLPELNLGTFADKTPSGNVPLPVN